MKMQDAKVHIIQRVSMQFDLGNYSNAFKDQQSISTLFNNYFLPEIDCVFNELSPHKEYQKIDKIEIDLGKINLNNTSDILHVFKSQIDEKLREALKTTKTETIRTEVLIFHQLLHFLIKGFLPWNSPFGNFDILCLEASALEYWETQPLLNLIKILQNKIYLKRLFYQANTSFLKRFQAELLSYYRKRGQVYSKKINLTRTRRSGLKSNLKTLMHGLNRASDFQENKEVSEDKKVLFNDNELIPISNAGIVLLNPVFRTLFERGNLLVNNSFLNDSTQEQAVFMLHYLATGQTKLDENDALIYKIICGIPFEQPIKRNFNLSIINKKMCEEALQAIVNEWKVLKNTSNDGLRENFIARNGNLKVKHDSYNIDVEQSSVDIVLSYNPPPWTISIISFPWMNKMLNVNWF